MSDDIKLLPCPCCGAPARFSLDFENGNGEPAVECSKCSLLSWEVDDWNRCAVVEADLARRPMPSDVNILGLAGEYIPPRGAQPDMAQEIINFARALLSRYGQPAASAEPVRDLLRDARHRIANLSRAAVPFDDPLDGPVLRRLDAAIDAPVVQEPVVPRLHNLADEVIIATHTGNLNLITEKIRALVQTVKAAPVDAQPRVKQFGDTENLKAEVSRLQKMFEAADKDMHAEAARGDSLTQALRGMLKLDEENHQRYSGDEDVCQEVQDARAALAVHGRAVTVAAQPSVPEGWQLMPENPTPPMQDAWDGTPAYDDLDEEFRVAYRAMLAAAPVAVQPTAPTGFALVPLRPNQAMQDVMDSDGWAWEDLLGAAEAITEQQYANIAAQSGVPLGLWREALEVLILNYGTACIDNDGGKTFAEIKAHLDTIVAPVAGQPSATGNPTQRFMADVTAELARARAKFPGDRIMTIALAEEFGELAKAMLDEPGANVWKEAVQTAVMAARVAVDGDSSVDDWRAAKGLDNHRDGGQS